jgi:hypothetical protein
MSSERHYVPGLRWKCFRIDRGHATPGFAARVFRRCCGRAASCGTLESGKLADLTILEQEPYKVDPDDLMNIKVSETWVGGQKKYG